MKGSDSSGRGTSQKKLGDAKGEEETQKRCKAILETIAPGRVKYWPSGEDYYINLPGGGGGHGFGDGGAWWVYLRRCHDGRIAICIYPGNTTCQARAFFKRARRHEFLALVGKGWEIQPNLA